jgi:cytochrome c2
LADPAKTAELVAQGDKLHKVCASCHSVDPGGANKTGPALYGVFGRTAGTHAGFANYSEAMKAYGKVTDEILKNIVKKMLQTQFLEKQLKPAIGMLKDGRLNG